MNMKLLFGILLLIAGAVVFGFLNKSKQEPLAIASPTDNPPSRVDTLSESSLSSQQITIGEVEIEVTPVSVASNYKDITLKLSLNTHSVDLSYDYTKIATLTDQDGNSYKPTQWTGDTGGHHLEDNLVFDSLL